jgi:hypothetical protein
MMVHDSMLEEIWRVRAQLLKQHGGLKGYHKYLEKVYRAHEKFARRHKLKPEGPELWEIDASLRGRYPKRKGRPTRMTPFRRPDPILTKSNGCVNNCSKSMAGWTAFSSTSTNSTALIVLGPNGKRMQARNGKPSPNENGK